jgi:regulator of sigma E protease
MFSFFAGITDYIIPFLIVLTLLVFVHELGHYLVARYNKVKVEVFSIGFGPELFGFYDQSGTRWKFSLIPLGGYIKMYGDADGSSRADGSSLEKMTPEEYAQTLHGKRVGQRMAVVAAGPIANYLFALVIMAFLFALKGMPIISAQIGEVLPHSVAQRIGLEVNDTISAINNTPVTKFDDLRAIIKENSGKEIQVIVKRPEGQETKTITLSGKLVTSPEQGEQPTTQLGIRPGKIEFEPLSPFHAIGHSFTSIAKITWDTLKGLGQMITGDRSSKELGGILAIGDMAGQSAKGGISSLLWFMALLSINLGLINLFPIPVLDGGHLVFYTIEAMRGKPLSQKAQEYAFLVGLFIVGSIMLMSTWNDLLRYVFK